MERFHLIFDFVAMLHSYIDPQGLKPYGMDDGTQLLSPRKIGNQFDKNGVDMTLLPYVDHPDKDGGDGSYKSSDDLDQDDLDLDLHSYNCDSNDMYGDWQRR